MPSICIRISDEALAFLRLRKFNPRLILEWVPGMLESDLLKCDDWIGNAKSLPRRRKVPLAQKRVPLLKVNSNARSLPKRGN